MLDSEAMTDEELAMWRDYAEGELDEETAKTAAGLELIEGVGHIIFWDLDDVDPSNG
jgi:hypothetical protein